jgi:hypothetical protein
MKIKEAAADFLGRKRVAVTGVSRHPKSHGIACFDPCADRGYGAMRVFFARSRATCRGTPEWERNVPRHA